MDFSKDRCDFLVDQSKVLFYKRLDYANHNVEAVDRCLVFPKIFANNAFHIISSCSESIGFFSDHNRQTWKMQMIRLA